MTQEGPTFSEREPSATDRVVGLMAALEESVANAKASRERATSDRVVSDANTADQPDLIGPDAT